MLFSETENYQIFQKPLKVAFSNHKWILSHFSLHYKELAHLKYLVIGIDFTKDLLIICGCIFGMVKSYW